MTPSPRGSRARAVAAACLLALAACRHPAPAPAAVALPAAPPTIPAVATREPPAPVDDPTDGRPLTPGEVALARTLFRDSIDYAAVRVVDAPFGPFHPAGVMMTPAGVIHAPSPLYRPDYSAGMVDLPLLADFFHELVHVWQHQNGQQLLAEAVSTFAAFRGDYARAYAYVLAADCDLMDYGFEQQASIVSDWFLLARHAHPRDLAAPTSKATYRAVLQPFLADPTYARGLAPTTRCRDPRPSP